MCRTREENAADLAYEESQNSPERLALEEIRAVACGEIQIGDDDTEALTWIFRKAEQALGIRRLAKIGDVEGPLRHCGHCGTEWTTGADMCPTCLRFTRTNR